MIQIKLSGYLVSLTIYFLTILLMTSISIKCNDGGEFYTYQYIPTSNPSENENPMSLNEKRSIRYGSIGISSIPLVRPRTYSNSNSTEYSGSGGGPLGWAATVFGMVFPVLCIIGVVITICCKGNSRS